MAPRKRRVDMNPAPGARDARVDPQPPVVGLDAEDALRDVTNVHAAVPVSQEFFASPGVAASGPAIICA